MKEAAAKSSDRPLQPPEWASSFGQLAVARRAPPYGIDFVDRGISPAALVQRTRNAQRKTSSIQAKSKAEHAGIAAPETSLPRSKRVASGGAEPGIGEGIDIVFIVRAPAKDEFTRSMTSYVETVLVGQAYQVVDNLDDMFSYLSALGDQHKKVRRIRLVAHGGKSGGVALTPAGGTKKWYTPVEIAAYAKKATVRDIVRKVITKGAVVEFWGCNIGNVPAAGQAWANLLHSTFVATTGTFRTEYLVFFRPASPGEKPESLNVSRLTSAQRRQKWVRVKSSREIDVASDALQQDFEAFLIKAYLILLRNKDIQAQEGDYPEVIRSMRELFDRAEGDIRRIVVSKGKTEKPTGPGDKNEWSRLWVSFEPINLEEAAGGNPNVKSAPTFDIPATAVETVKADASTLDKPKESSSSREQSRVKNLMADENVRFLRNVGNASFKASEALPTEDERRFLLSRLGWSLTVFFPLELSQGHITQSKVAEIAELWAVKLNLVDSSETPQSSALLINALLKLTPADLKRLRDSAVDRPGSVDETPREFRRDSQNLPEEKIEQALAKVSQEDVSKLDKIEKVWDAISNSNTQQVISYVMGDVLGKLTRLLPKTRVAAQRLSKLWTLRHVGTLFLDILVVRDGDRRSARRLMFLDTQATIDLYEFLTQSWPAEEDRRKRSLELVSTPDEVHFEQKGSRAPLDPDALFTGVTLEKFGTLFLTDRESAITLAEAVGGYVWKYSPRMGTPVGKEALRRIDEGLKLLRDGISAASDVYALFNPVWNVMQTIIATGELLHGKP